MNYLTNYYKNLCEQLQAKINIIEMQLNEAGLKKALKTGDPELLRRAEATTSARRENYLNMAIEAGQKLRNAERRYGAGSPETGPHALEAEIRHQQSREMISNLNKIEKAKERNLTPNAYDGPDEDSEGSSEEVIDAQQQNQMTGPLTASPLVTSGMFPDMKTMLDKLTIRKK